MSKSKINVITLGCSKNLVDSEFLLRQLEVNNLSVEHDAENSDARTVILNTCGFIDDAKEESIEMILQFTNAKKNGLIDNLYVMGCLSQRFKNDLSNEISGVDRFFGVNDLTEIVKELGQKIKKTELLNRYITTPKHFAYLKISEGCDRTCAFCAIPIIRGKHKSKPIETLVEETKLLVKQGVKEIILIAQDLSYYGLDIYKEQKLAELVNKLSDIEGVKWIRLHYFYPSNFPLNILKVIRKKKNVCNYIDIAFQHISDNMLSAMKRNISKEQTYNLISTIRKEVPNVSLRTSILTGFPNESEKDFDDLINFVTEIKFDRLGTFTYSHEEDTYAYKHYVDNISDEEKNKREAKIMEIQQDISEELNLQKVGKTLQVLIDKKEDDIYFGRTEYDSPEVDTEVIIENNEMINIGEFYNVKITGFDNFDLYGEII